MDFTEMTDEELAQLQYEAGVELGRRQTAAVFEQKISALLDEGQAAGVIVQHEDGTPAKVSSVASGLVYPGIGPEIAMLHQSGRIAVSTISDKQVIDTFFRMARIEGIIPALESAHALAFAFQLAAERPRTERILVNLSGRGDKDVDYVLEHYRNDLGD